MESASLEDQAWEKVIKHVEKVNIKGFHIMEDRIGSFMMTLKDQSHLIVLRVKRRNLMITVRFPLHVAKGETENGNRRDNMAVLLSRINDHLMVGGFRLDHDDGEVTFNNSTLFDENLTDETIQYLISVMTVKCHSAIILEQTFSSPNPHTNFSKLAQQKSDQMVDIISTIMRSMSTEEPDGEEDELSHSDKDSDEV